MDSLYGYPHIYHLSASLLQLLFLTADGDASNAAARLDILGTLK